MQDYAKQMAECGRESRIAIGAKVYAEATPEQRMNIDLRHVIPTYINGQFTYAYVGPPLKAD